MDVLPFRGELIERTCSGLAANQRYDDILLTCGLADCEISFLCFSLCSVAFYQLLHKFEANAYSGDENGSAYVSEGDHNDEFVSRCC